MKNNEEQELPPLRMLSDKEFWEHMKGENKLDENNPDYCDKAYEIQKGMEELKMQEKW